MSRGGAVWPTRQREQALRAALRAADPREAGNEAKNIMGVIRDHVSASPNIEDFRPLFAKNADHPHLLDAVKQIGFYSDCLARCHWSIPAEVVDEGLADVLVSNARALVRHELGAMESAEELRLWVKHLRPVWGRSMSAMKRALIDCYQEARELGVLQGRGDVEGMVKFLL